jgi:hypothetical protein
MPAQGGRDQTDYLPQERVPRGEVRITVMGGESGRIARRAQDPGEPVLRPQQEHRPSEDLEAEPIKAIDIVDVRRFQAPADCIEKITQ